MDKIQLTPEQYRIAKPLFDALDARRDGFAQGMETAKTMFLQLLLKGELSGRLAPAELSDMPHTNGVDKKGTFNASK